RALSSCENARASLDQFRRWLTDVPAAPPERYTIGQDRFALFLSRGHFCQNDAASLAFEARAALDDALNELDRRGRAAATGGWPEVQARLADAHPTTDQYLAAYRRIWDDCRASADRANLVTWPDYPIRYVPMPVHTRDAAPLLYYLFYR